MSIKNILVPNDYDIICEKFRMSFGANIGNVLTCNTSEGDAVWSVAVPGATGSPGTPGATGAPGATGTNSFANDYLYVTGSGATASISTNYVDFPFNQVLKNGGNWELDFQGATGFGMLWNVPTGNTGTFLISPTLSLTDQDVNSFYNSLTGTTNISNQFVSNLNVLGQGFHDVIVSNNYIATINGQDELHVQSKAHDFSNFSMMLPSQSSCTIMRIT
jgi:hypothetical protein